MKKKIIFSFFILTLSLKPVKADIIITFLHKGRYYEVSPFERKDINIETFDPLKIIDQSQKYRLILSSLEKSRLASLFFVGDKYEFNDVQLELIDTTVYKITDKLNYLSIKFSTGKYDNIIINSAINFGRKEFNDTDKIATSLTVKYLLKKMTGKLERVENKITNRGLSKPQIDKEFKKFLDELKTQKPGDIIYYLTKFAELNFELDLSNKNLTDEWTNPVDLYFYKKGDYKSFAFFYYYVLKEIGYSVKLYLVAPLIKRDEKELNELYEIFINKKNKDYIYKVQELEQEYERVDSKKILKDFSDNYYESMKQRPAPIFFYKPPDFNSAVLITAVKINEKWMYTTGNKWISTEIINPDRICYHYSGGICYYSQIINDIIDTIIFNNLPFTERDLDILWDVYYE
ncbi:MAG: hypothetical protein JXB50_16810 [Spirochaetes bacterium]|nr:hypothetical protein [Spirochaetota bacterium]